MTTRYVIHLADGIADGYYKSGAIAPVSRINAQIFQNKEIAVYYVNKLGLYMKYRVNVQKVKA